MLRMLQRAIAIIFVLAIEAQENEPFKLPTLNGNAFFADPFASHDSIGSVWGLSSASKGKTNAFNLNL